MTASWACCTAVSQLSRRCTGGGTRGRREGVNRFWLARAVIASPIIFFLHNQSTPSPSRTTVNVNTLSVPSVGPLRRRTKRLNSGPKLRWFRNHICYRPVWCAAQFRADHRPIIAVSAITHTDDNTETAPRSRHFRFDFGMTSATRRSSWLLTFVIISG